MGTKEPQKPLQILVIWQEVPENVKAYVLTDVTPVELGHLRKCHGNLINTTSLTAEEEAALEWLNLKIEKAPVYWDGTPGGGITSPTGTFDLVIVTGFML